MLADSTTWSSIDCLKFYFYISLTCVLPSVIYLKKTLSGSLWENIGIYGGGLAISLKTFHGFYPKFADDVSLMLDHAFMWNVIESHIV